MKARQSGLSWIAKIVIIMNRIVTAAGLLIAFALHSAWAESRPNVDAKSCNFDWRFAKGSYNYRSLWTPQAVTVHLE